MKQKIRFSIQRIRVHRHIIQEKVRYEKQNSELEFESLYLNSYYLLAATMSSNHGFCFRFFHNSIWYQTKVQA